MINDPTYNELKSVKAEILSFNRKYFSNLSENEQNSINFFIKE